MSSSRLGGHLGGGLSAGGVLHVCLDAQLGPGRATPIVDSQLMDFLSTDRVCRQGVFWKEGWDACMLNVHGLVQNLKLDRQAPF